MRIDFVSYHLLNETAEGLVAARVAGALAAAGHEVVAVTSQDNWMQGSFVVPAEGPLRGVHVYRVPVEPARTSRLWRFLQSHQERGFIWSRLATGVNLLKGHGPMEAAWARAVAARMDGIWSTEGAPDVLHSRLNPPSSHLAALEIRRRRRDLPWCAYFSDPWPFHLFPPPYGSRARAPTRWREERVLDSVLRGAQSLCFPSQRLERFMLRGERLVHRAKSFAISHLGSRFCGSEGSRDPGESLVLRHAGLLTLERRVDPLLAGLSELFRRRPDARTRVRLEFVGRFIAGSIPALPPDLQDCVGFSGYLDYGDTLRWLREADALVLIEAKLEEGIFFPSKLSDYLRARRPVLALSPLQGVAADLLSSQSALVAEPDDESGIAAALELLFDRWQEGDLDTLVPGESARDQVSEPQVVARWEEALRFAIAGSSAGRSGTAPMPMAG